MRDTLPSLFLSAAEKFGADADAPALALPLMPELELWPELEPEAAEPLEVLEGELDELAPLLLEGVCAEVEPLLDFSPAANEAPDSARSAAAVALTRTFTFMVLLLRREKRGLLTSSALHNASAVPVLLATLARLRRAGSRRWCRSRSSIRRLTSR